LRGDEAISKVPSWTIEVVTVGDKSKMAKLDIRIERTEDAWIVDIDAIEAVLGMWLAQLSQDGLSRDWIPCKEDNLWLLLSANEVDYEIWQVLLDFLVIGQPQLKSVGDIAEACEQNHIDIRRVFHTVPPSGTPDRIMRRAMTTETDRFEMCGQFLIMSFFSQNAALFKKRCTTPSLKNIIGSSGSTVLITDPLFEEIRDCLSQTSIFPKSEDANFFAFCILCQTGDFQILSCYYPRF
jgi:hypothetical protein